MTRRFVSLLVLFSICSFALEAAVPDIHDGEASADELARVGGGYAGVVDQSHAPETPRSPDTGFGHFHLCHRSHTHSPPSTARVGNEEVEPHVEPPIGTTARIPDAVSLDVKVRPPIA